jgi:hypothetical protein
VSLRPTAIEAESRDHTTSTVRQIAHEYQLVFVGSVYAAHWLLVTIVAALATRFAYANPPVKALGWALPHLDGASGLFVQPMRNWDGFWYSLIAELGYVHSATTAFWPLYPWSMRFLGTLLLIPYETAGYMLSNIAFLIALVALYRYVSTNWGVDVARRSVLLLAFFPTAFFFTAVYSESFFLLFCVLAFSWGRMARWWLAGSAALLAGLTRNVGVLLIVPLGIMFLRQYGPGLRGRWLDLRAWPAQTLALGLIPLGPVLYMLYLWRAFGNPLMTIDAQKGWARIQAMPWTTFRMAFDQWQGGWLYALLASPTWATLTSYPVRMSFAEYESLDIAMTFLGIVLIVYAFRVLPIEHSAWVAIMFALPLFSPSTIHPLMSIPRFMVVLFPLFIALAIFARRRFVLPIILVPSAVLMVLLTVQFSTWFWVS